MAACLSLAYDLNNDAAQLAMGYAGSIEYKTFLDLGGHECNPSTQCLQTI